MCIVVLLVGVCCVVTVACRLLLFLDRCLMFAVCCVIAAVLRVVLCLACGMCCCMSIAVGCSLLCVV